MLVLLARGVGPGDAVICPAFTFCATAEVVALVGATPVFADVDAATFNLDAASLKRAAATARHELLSGEAARLLRRRRRGAHRRCGACRRAQEPACARPGHRQV